MLSLSVRINLYLGQVQFETDTIFIYFDLFLTKTFKTGFNLKYWIQRDRGRKSDIYSSDF